MVKFCFCPLQFPYQPFAVPCQIEPLILLVTPGYVQRRGAVCPAFLLEQERAIRCAEQTICAGNHIESIIGRLLARMMHQQQTNAAFVGKAFQTGHHFIIAGIAALFAAVLPDFLQRIDNDKPCVRVFTNKALELRFQTFV